jgi:hypothetical protein
VTRGPYRGWARLCGIQTSYYDVTCRRRQASSGSLLSGLRVCTSLSRRSSMSAMRTAPWGRLPLGSSWPRGRLPGPPAEFRAGGAFSPDRSRLQFARS